MRRRVVAYSLVLTALTVISVLIYVSQSVPGAGCSLARVGEVQLPNAVGSLDHMAVDTQNRTLFVAVRSNDSIAVVDIAKQKLNFTASGFNLPQSISVPHGGGEIVVSNGGNGKVSILDQSSLRTIASISLASNADNMALDAKYGLLYVGFGQGGVAVVNTTSWAIERSLQFPGHPEGMAADQQGRYVFVNVPADNYIAVLDRARGNLVGDIPLGNVSGSFPMAVDSADHLLFVATRTPSYFLAINESSGADVYKMRIPSDTDDIAFDSARGCVYISSGQGYVTVIKQAGPAGYRLIQNVSTSQGARTSFLDAKGGLFFLAAPAVNGEPAAVIFYKVEGKG